MIPNNRTGLGIKEPLSTNSKNLNTKGLFAVTEHSD
jgi:hypothetical protein